MIAVLVWSIGNWVKKTDDGQLFVPSAIFRLIYGGKDAWVNFDKAVIIISTSKSEQETNTHTAMSHRIKKTNKKICSSQSFVPLAGRFEAFVISDLSVIALFLIKMSPGAEIRAGKQTCFLSIMPLDRPSWCIVGICESDVYDAESGLKPCEADWKAAWHGYVRWRNEGGDQAIRPHHISQSCSSRKSCRCRLRALVHIKHQSREMWAQAAGVEIISLTARLLGVQCAVEFAQSA